jgi:hypothetical protein
MAGTPLATAFVRVRPQVDQAAFRRDTERGIAGTGKTAGRKFATGFLKVATASFALAGGLELFKGFIRDATESQKAAAQTAAVLKSTGGAAGVTAAHVARLSAALQKNVAVSDETIQAGQNMLLTFTGIRNETGRGNKIFDQATRVLTDMTAALNNGAVTSEAMRSQAIQLGKALNDPVRGLSALRRVGVAFTAQQEDQIKTLVESGKTMQAQKIILHELGREFAGSAAAAATPAERLKLAFGDLSEKIGTALMPILTKVTGFLIKSVVPALEKMFAFITRNAGTIKTLAMVLIPAAAGIFLLVKAHDAYLAIQKAWLVATKAQIVVQTALNLVMRLNPIGLVITALAALVGGLIYAYNHFKWFRDFVNAVWSSIQTAAENLKQWLWNDFVLKIVHFFTETVPAGFDIFKQAVALAWDGIKLMFLKGVYFITGLMAKLPGPLGAPFREAHDNIGRELDKIQADVLKHVLAINKDWEMLHGKTAVIKFSSAFLASHGVPVAPATNAKGTPGAAPGWSWVGEKGPELIRLKGGETIIPSHIARGYAKGTMGGYADLFTPALQPFLREFASHWWDSIRRIVRYASTHFAGGFSGALGGGAAANMALARRLFPWPASMWSSFFGLEMGEAGFNRFARNPASGAYGIPQALPPTKMPFAAQAAGGSHAGPQLGWMFDYIRSVYGTPAAAYSAWLGRSPHWYGKGGWITEPIAGVGLRSGRGYGFGEHGAEYVSPGGADLGQVISHLAAGNQLLATLIGAVDDNARATAAGVAGAIGGAAKTATYRARYSAR